MRRHPWPLISICLFLLIWVLLVASPKSLAAPTAPGALSGQIRTPAGLPLAGAEVTLFSVAGSWTAALRTTTADGDGRYTFTLLAPGSYLIKAADPHTTYAFQFYGQANHPSTAQPIGIAGNHVTAQDITLPVGAIITGTITVQAPLTHTVALYQETTPRDWQQIAQQTYGPPPAGADTISYIMAGLPPATYHICVWEDQWRQAECYDNLPHSALATATGITVQAGDKVANVNFLMGDYPGTRQIAGTVTSIAGEPLAGIELYAQDADDGGPFPIPAAPTTRTNAHGAYWIPVTAGTRFTLRLIDPQGAYVSQYHTTEDGTGAPPLLTLQPDALVTRVDVALTPASVITGTVTLRDTVGSYAHGTVYAYRTTTPQVPQTIHEYFGAAIDPQTGHYTLNGLPSGFYRLQIGVAVDPSAYANGIAEYYRDSQTITAATPISLVVGQTITNVLINVGEEQYNSTLQGTITAEGKPLPGIRVGINTSCCVDPPIMVYTTTDAAGRYRLDGLLSGRYLIHVYDPTNTFAGSYYRNAIVDDDAERVTLATNQVIADLNVALTRAGAIQGTVRDRHGRQIAKGWVSVTVQSQRDPRAWVTVATTPLDANDTYRFQGLNPAVYQLYVNVVIGNQWLRQDYGCSQSGCAPSLVRVEANQVTEPIDFTVGAATWLYLPLIQR